MLGFRVDMGRDTTVRLGAHVPQGGGVSSCRQWGLGGTIQDEWRTQLQLLAENCACPEDQLEGDQVSTTSEGLSSRCLVLTAAMRGKLLYLPSIWFWAGTRDRQQSCVSIWEDPRAWGCCESNICLLASTRRDLHVSWGSYGIPGFRHGNLMDRRAVTATQGICKCVRACDSRECAGGVFVCMCLH